MTPAAVLSELAIVLDIALDDTLPALEAQRIALKYANQVHKSNTGL
jgi:hypothetical protein